MESLADPHCHTTASDGMVSPSELVDGALGAGLSLIAITDHDTMANAAEVRSRGEAAGLGVIQGQELTTRWPAQTHILGWFLEKPVRSGMTLLDTVKAIHAQGGLAVVPHPFMPTYFASCQPGMLQRLIEQEPVDGIELSFTAPSGAWRRAALERFYESNMERLGAQVGASDSHFGGFDLGGIVTVYPGAGVEDFRRAVMARRTAPRRGRAVGPPLALRARQQVRSLVALPLRRLRGQSG